MTHGYDGIDYPVLWKAFHEKLPGLLETVRRMQVDLDRAIEKNIDQPANPP